MKSKKVLLAGLAAVGLGCAILIGSLGSPFGTMITSASSNNGGSTASGNNSSQQQQQQEQKPSIPDVTTPPSGWTNVPKYPSNDVVAETLPVDPMVKLVLQNDGRFHYYYNKVADMNKFGFVNWISNTKFLIANGLVANINGLANDPEHSEIWYFCSQGQVQNQYTGLALYDGQWFYINNGKLNTTYNGFVMHDGSYFYVAAGRIVKEYSGLVWDNNGGKEDWFYLANGQVQNQYTGLAQYDNHWFYIVQGKLASYYRGNVSWNGGNYRVEGGQVK